MAADPLEGASPQLNPDLLRPYMVTGGRTESAHGSFDLISLVVAVAGPLPTGLNPEHLSILRLCQTATSVAELSSSLDLPPGAVSVLLGDLLERQLIDVRAPQPDVDTYDLHVYKAVIDGLRSL
ncbi:DUF742 domain-containing protein [Nonomuraea sp. NBC_01738]|uniref:DUF742 domain-containing protein n=1 Tax=Nonomuraea sp. NBC_01738 TaxID=2976003 RepID=UPI002E102836|nr:DUF742 domain-containing protein [Nonomuraea sp. NBC_01738]